LRDAYARGLMMAGVKKGDVVTLCMPVSVENTLVLFAAVIMSRELIILDEIQECPKTLMSFLERGIPMSV
jgi:acyl-CoA synthetase (AMP-forming)/AMP-acid ligase II